MTTPPPADPSSVAADHLGDIVFWIVIGLAFLWVIAMVAEVTLQRLKPVLVFIVVAALVGMVVLKAVAGWF
ncbi:MULTISPECIES: hypothetical protein [unclassified Gordonia (in: high G+C Gram-positive bacteria)]|uniref:hypothetical protein n=1 Tax=unclassified Gordonia (in: high G+C Gram-positive bacteria) TaxID=2657482 RepID=UPI000815E6FB|nr:MULTISPECIES: hypothetical protein [unclassified Gordonia (in: high G+C Gram-positive bacteria)]SCC56077.1 hypothetical protein GA0061091_12721 [Gordonia sp. v-85]